jgi:uncharacterized protein YodC (DUF2158 family)
MKLMKRQFPVSSLRVVARGEDMPGTRERLHLGDRVTLISGGPPMLVVDVDGDNVAVSWKDDAGGVVEDAFSRGCLSLIPPAASAYAT